MKSVILILIFTISLNLYGQQMKNSKNEVPQLGKEAPTFSLPDMKQQYLALHDLCGPKLNKPWINKTKYVVVLSFFATWCIPCMKEIPHLEKIKEKFTGQSVKFFLIDVGEEETKLQEFLEGNPVKLDILVDRYNKVAEKYDALTLPRLYVIDREGIIRKEQKGFTNPEQFETELTGLLTDLLK